MGRGKASTAAAVLYGPTVPRRQASTTSDTSSVEPEYWYAEDETVVLEITDELLYFLEGSGQKDQAGVLRRRGFGKRLKMSVEGEDSSFWATVDGEDALTLLVDAKSLVLLSHTFLREKAVNQPDKAIIWITPRLASLTPVPPQARIKLE